MYGAEKQRMLRVQYSARVRNAEEGYSTYKNGMEPAIYILRVYFFFPFFFVHRYKAHRVAQAFEVAHIIRLTSRSPLVLLLVSTPPLPPSVCGGAVKAVFCFFATKRAIILRRPYFFVENNLLIEPPRVTVYIYMLYCTVVCSSLS